MHQAHTSSSLDRGNATTTRPASEAVPSRPLPQPEPPTTMLDSSQPGKEQNKLVPTSSKSPGPTAHLVKFEPVGVGGTQDQAPSDTRGLWCPLTQVGLPILLHKGQSTCSLGLLSESLGPGRADATATRDFRTMPCHISC